MMCFQTSVRNQTIYSFADAKLNFEYRLSDLSTDKS